MLHLLLLTLAGILLSGPLSVASSHPPSILARNSSSRLPSFRSASSPPPSRQPSDALIIPAWPRPPVKLHITRDVQATIVSYGPVSSTRREDVDMAAAALEAIEYAIYARRVLAKDEHLNLRSNMLTFRLNLYGKPWPTVMRDIARLVHLLAMLSRTCGEAIGIREAYIEEDSVLIAEFMVEIKL